MAAENGSLHPVDTRILEILQTQGRISNVQLAAEVGLSPSAVLERVRKLEERGIIERYVTILDNRKLGLGTIAFVAVSLNLHHQDSIENFHAFVRANGKVLECFHVAGGEDYLLKVYTRDVEDYERFLLTSLTRTKGIDKVKTMFVLSTLKRETAIPLDAAPLNGKAKGSNGGELASASKGAEKGPRAASAAARARKRRPRAAKR
ncbi:MAG: Lrp/AsnC family transcriptional regulator [Candidatus Latescibacterota bacterium]|jgi:Lrp/AsnC family leucine-responsive transcriptional regulator|nr:MAG: Lrp/AsnC family transcriptional regulator [Candidatus Latescibacterota bacterium]